MEHIITMLKGLSGWQIALAIVINSLVGYGVALLDIWADKTRWSWRFLLRPFTYAHQENANYNMTGWYVLGMTVVGPAPKFVLIAAIWVYALYAYCFWLHLKAYYGIWLLFKNAGNLIYIPAGLGVKRVRTSIVDRVQDGFSFLYKSTNDYAGSRMIALMPGFFLLYIELLAFECIRKLFGG